MNIYFNWLGKWIEIDNENDYIHDMEPNSFISSLYQMNNKYDIVEIKKKDFTYYVPTSQIVWKEKKSKYINEEWY